VAAPDKSLATPNNGRSESSNPDCSLQSALARRRLFLKPAATSFDLHMAGAWGFHWDEPLHSLAIPLPREWSYRDWFEHVVAIIGGEHGVHLKLGPHTEWTSVPSIVRAEIESSNA
jgi:hypothetical protein